METNLFEGETADISQEKVDGKELILNFLKNCKKLQESIMSDDALMEEISKLKQELLQHENKYVKALMI